MYSLDRMKVSRINELKTTHSDRKQVTVLPRKLKASNVLVSYFWVKHSQKTHPTGEVLTREGTYCLL